MFFLWLIMSQFRFLRQVGLIGHENWEIKAAARTSILSLIWNNVNWLNKKVGPTKIELAMRPSPQSSSFLINQTPNQSVGVNSQTTIRIIKLCYHNPKGF